VVAILGQVRSLPLALGLLVIALGLVTLLHALVVTSHCRDQEAKTLRALGLGPRAIGSLAVTHSTFVALIALVVGIPLGLALGRLVWALIAERSHVIDVATRPWTDAASVALAVVLSGVILAVPVALRSMRRQLAVDLRPD